MHKEKSAWEWSEYTKVSSLTKIVALAHCLGFYRLYRGISVLVLITLPLSGLWGRSCSLSQRGPVWGFGTSLTGASASSAPGTCPYNHNTFSVLSRLGLQLGTIGCSGQLSTTDWATFDKSTVHNEEFQPETLFLESISSSNWDSWLFYVFCFRSNNKNESVWVFPWKNASIWKCFAVLVKASLGGRTGQEQCLAFHQNIFTELQNTLWDSFRWRIREGLFKMGVSFPSLFICCVCMLTLVAYMPVQQASASGRLIILSLWTTPDATASSLASNTPEMEGRKALRWMDGWVERTRRIYWKG